MLSNDDVIKAFYQGKEAKNRSLTSTGNSLLSYDTCIVQRVNGKVIANATRYSNTTSRHRSAASIWHADMFVIGLARGVHDLQAYPIASLQQVSKYRHWRH
jgi:hypothetical protein